MAIDVGATDDSVIHPRSDGGVSQAQVPEHSERSADHPAAAHAPPAQHGGPRLAGTRFALVSAITIITMVVALVAWLGMSLHKSYSAGQRAAQYLATARQAAENLTTIDFENAEADVQRILDSATGQFHENFTQRSQPFIDVVKKAQSKSAGKITAAGIESVQAGQARVLVAASVTTSNAGAQEQQPRLWRMRVVVQDVGPDLKISDVQFVP